MVLRLEVMFALVAAVALSIAGLIGYANHQKNRAERAESMQASAEQARDLAGSITNTVERFHTRTVTITEQAEAVADEVQAIPSCELGPDLVGAWRNGLHNVTAGAIGDPVAGNPASPLPASEPGSGADGG